MSKYIIQGETLTNIADAIRNKTGSNDLMNPDGMVVAITGIKNDGIDPAVFKDLTERSITEINVPDGTTKVGAYTFSNCKNLRKVTLPDTITQIESYAFDGCLALETINLPPNLDALAGQAFRKCTSLKKVYIPASVRSIANQVFYECTALIEVTFQGKPSLHIQPTVFQYCTNLTTINVPWAEGEVANAPWGATDATINYNYTE